MTTAPAPPSSAPAAPSWTPEHDRRVRAGGLKIRVRVRGEGRPVLLVNGIGAHIGMWAPLAQSLGDGFQLIAFDAPGTGRSQTPLVPRRLGGIADVAAGVLDALEIEAADVLGYSLGGVIAQYLAHRSPSRVRRLVLAATTPGWGGVPGSTLAMLHMTTPLRYYIPAYYRAVAGGLMGGRARFDKEWVAAQARERAKRPPSPWGYAGQLTAVSLSGGTLNWLKDVQAPTLVLSGDDDPLVPLANSLLLAHVLPRGRLHVVPGEGHLLLLDTESGVGDLVRDFFAAEPLSSSRAWAEAQVVRRESVDAALWHSLTITPNPVANASAAYRLWRRSKPATLTRRRRRA